MLEMYRGEYEIVLMEPNDPNIYRWLGPFATDRAIIKELEGPIYHDAGTTWLFASHRGRIVALSGLRMDEKPGVAGYTLTYVLPAHRRRGLYRRMFGLKLDLCRERGVQVVRGLANPISRAVFEEQAFRLVGMRGKWARFEKEMDHA